MNIIIRPMLAVAIAAVAGACAIGNSGQAQAASLCEKAGETSNGSVKHEGRDRNYRIVLPSGASSDKPAPLIVVMHGGWGTGDAVADQTGLSDIAGRKGFAVAYPNGIWRSWNAGSCCGRAASGNVDDVGFISKMVKELGEQSCIDKDRVYATGFSNGAMMAHRLACEAPELFRAIAPVAGGPMVADCKSDRPMPSLLLIGREDERIPWDGGTFDDTYRPSIAEQVKQLAQRNQCGDEDKALSGQDGSCRQRDGCRGGSLHWCVIDGVGHQWPGGSTILPRLLGANRNAVKASNMIVDFFEAN